MERSVCAPGSRIARQCWMLFVSMRCSAARRVRLRRLRVGELHAWCVVNGNKDNSVVGWVEHCAYHNCLTCLLFVSEVFMASTKLCLGMGEEKNLSLS